MSYVSMNDLLAPLGWPDGWIDGVKPGTIEKDFGMIDGGAGAVIYIPPGIIERSGYTI